MTFGSYNSFAPANYFPACFITDSLLVQDELRMFLVTPELDVKTANDGRANPEELVDELLIALRLTLKRCGEPKAYHACATANYCKAHMSFRISVFETRL